MDNSGLPRYVLLEHTIKGSVHYDLMLEQPGREKLRTLQLEARLAAHEQTCPAREIDEHRRAYLDYEGPVSGDRGTVRRIEQGRYVPRPAPLIELTLLPEDAPPYQLHLDNPVTRAFFHQPPLPAALRAFLESRKPD